MHSHCMCVLVTQLCPTLCGPMDCGPWLLCLWDSPDKNTRVGCHWLLQGIFLNQGSNPDLPHCGQILYHLSHQGSWYHTTCLAGKESACNVEDLGLILGLGRSPGEEKCYTLQYSGLENFMDCVVHGVTKSWTQLSDFYTSPIYHYNG